MEQTWVLAVAYADQKRLIGGLHVQSGWPSIHLYITTVWWVECHTSDGRKARLNGLEVDYQIVSVLRVS